MNGHWPRLGLTTELSDHAGMVRTRVRSRSRKKSIMSTHIDYAAESFRTTSRGGGLLAEDLERLRDYGESGWEIDHVVAHGENQNAMLFVFKRVTEVPV